MKICKNCGTENQENNAFCPACGGQAFVHRCAGCGAEFEGNFCPNCGTKADAEQPDRQPLPPERPRRKVTFGRVLLWIFFLPIMAIIAIWRSQRLKTPMKIALTGLIVLVLVLYYRPRGGKATPAAVRATQRPAIAATERPAQPRVTELPATKKPTATPKPTAKPTPKPTEDPTPKEYRNALAKAQLYVDMMYMSKARLYTQLTSPYGERVSEEAAQYALEHVKADWKENALKTAENYSRTMHMSKARIYDQLTSEYGEKFTAEEAQYAIDTIQADWNANALATARNYRDNLHMSPAAIQNQLTSPYGEKFTQEEAQYAMKHLDD